MPRIGNDSCLRSFNLVDWYTSLHADEGNLAAVSDGSGDVTFVVFIAAFFMSELCHIDTNCCKQQTRSILSARICSQNSLKLLLICQYCFICLFAFSYVRLEPSVL